MGLGSMQRAAEIYVGILAATILFIATNAGHHRRIAAELLDGPAPPAARVPAALHPRFRTPYVAIFVFGAMACLAILPGQADFLGVIYAFGAMLSFTIAHAARDDAALQATGRRAAIKGPLNVRCATETPALRGAGRDSARASR